MTVFFCVLGRDKIINIKLFIHATSSNAVATNQVIFLSVILARSTDILSCQEIPTNDSNNMTIERLLNVQYNPNKGQRFYNN